MKKKYLLIFIIIAIGAVTAITLLKKPQKKIVYPDSYKMKTGENGKLYMEKEEFDPETEEYAYDPEKYQRNTSSRFLIIFPKSWTEWQDGKTIATISEDNYNENMRGTRIPPQGEVIFEIYTYSFEDEYNNAMDEEDAALFEMKPGQTLETGLSTVTKIEDLKISGHDAVRTRRKFTAGGELVENMIIENILLKSLHNPQSLAIALHFRTDQEGYEKHKDEIEAMIRSFSTPESQMKDHLPF